MKIRSMARAALFAALITVCAWLSIPVPPLRFTLQTLGIMLSLGLLGGKWGTVSTALYLLLGAVGLPVFSGFRGGIGAFLDPTGGFLWGFLLGSLGYWLTRRFGRIPALLVFVLIAYGCGLGWFLVYAPGTSVTAAFLTCVAPYILPEAVKLWLANALVKRIGNKI